MRSPEEVKRDLVRQWMAKAEEDLGAAKALLSMGTSFLSAVGFHAQQAAEKYLKAFLTWHQIEFPKTHDIEELLELIATSDAALADSLRSACVLTQHAVEPRYPGAGAKLTQEGAGEAVGLASEVRDAVVRALPREYSPS